MKTVRSIVALSLLTLSLAACGSDKPEPKEDTSIISDAVGKAIVEARQELRESNITVSHEKNGLPKAEITPKGDLLIDGKAVAVNAQQRALLLEYRGHIAGIAEAGMQIGLEASDLAAHAMGEAFKGIFSGKSEKQIEQSVEARKGKVETAAKALCARLPAMMASQQKLAAALPEFKPYAKMTQEDVDDCYKDGHVNFDTDSITAGKDAAQDAADAARDAADAANEAADAAKEAADAAKEAANAATQQ